MSLAAKAEPVIKARARIVIGVAHVPFANEACPVASLLQVFGEKDGAVGDGALVVNDAVTECVQAGKDGRATW